MLGNQFSERPKQNEKEDSIAYLKTLIENAKISNKKEDEEKLEKLMSLIKTKKYGLIWEEHEEKVYEEIKTKIPVFVEDESKKSESNDNEEKFNFFLEGDNLHSLHLLEKTHLAKTDVIYIDPPYNTGHKDFKYNDHFLKSDDSFKHSKWLSFMEKRLTIAKKLLTSDGVIFVSIDENEQANLELLMNEIFGSENKVGEFIWKGRSGKGGTNSQIAFQHEYIKVYAKNASVVNFYQINKISDKDKIENLRQWGDNGPFRIDRPTMFFPVLINREKQEYLLPSDEEILKLYNRSTETFNDDILENLIKKYQALGYSVVLPKREDSEDGFGRWRQGVPGFKNLINENLLSYSVDKNDNIALKKIIPSGKESTIAIDSILETFGTSTEGTKEIKRMFGKKVFDTTKPIDLIKYLLFLGTFNKPNAIILDFFAGSGTTGEAVVELNKIDNGNRSFIIATNNENHIAEEVTYPRLKKVADGYETLAKFKDVVHEEKLTMTNLKKMNSILERFENIKLNNKNYYDKLTIKIDDEKIKLFGEYNKNSMVPPENLNLKYLKTNFINKEKFPDISLEYELLKHVTTLIELQLGIDSSNPNVQIIMNEEQLNNLFDKKQLTNNSILFLHPDVFFDDKQNQLIKNLNIEIQEIPRYFFGKELWEK